MRAGIRVLVGGSSNAGAFDQALFTAMICDSGFDSVRSTHFCKRRCVDGLQCTQLLASVLQTAIALPLASGCPGPVIPVAAIVLSLGLAASATPKNLAAAGVALAAGLVVYVLRRRS